MNPARRTIRRLREALLGFLYARRLLAARITSERAMAAVRRRIDERPQAFLEMMERNIFAQPPHPYGGPTSRGIRRMLSATNHCMEAERLFISLVAYGLEARPVAVWLPNSHGAALWAVLAFTARGRVPGRW